MAAPFYVVVEGLRGSRDSFPSVEAAETRARELFDYHKQKLTVRIVETIGEIEPIKERPIIRIKRTNTGS